MGTGEDGHIVGLGAGARTEQGRGLGFCAQHVENRENKVEDKLQPVYSGQDGADNLWAKPERTRALAPGRTPA